MTTNVDLHIDRIVRVAHELLNDSGGSTISLTGEPYPNSGYLVGGVVPEVKVRTCDREVIRRFIADHFELLTLDKRFFLGLWQGPEFVHIDVSERYADLNSAIKVAQERGELAIWDASYARSIDV